MNRVSLNKDEAQWFSRNVLKMIALLESAEVKDKEILSRTTYKTLNSMREQAQAAGTEDQAGVELMLSRKQKQVVRELLQSVNKALVERILPEYKRRGGHEKYIEIGEAKAKQLDAMQRKFK